MDDSMVQFILSSLNITKCDEIVAANWKTALSMMEGTIFQ